MLGTAGILMPVVRRLGVSPVVGFLVAGAVLGPLGLGSFVKQIPLLFWVTITNASNVSGIAEFGVIFLLFLIGLEMTFERLSAMRRAIFVLGGSQWLLARLRSPWPRSPWAMRPRPRSCSAPAWRFHRPPS